MVDWEEETPDALHPAHAQRPQPHHSQGAPEMVALPGGCLLNLAEYRRLEEFKKGGHVRKWYTQQLFKKKIAEKTKFTYERKSRN